MPIQDQDLLVRAAKVPYFDALVHRASGNKTVIVFAPVSREDLISMCLNGHCGGRFPQVPDFEREVPRRRQEDVCICWVPVQQLQSAQRVRMRSTS